MTETNEFQRCPSIEASCVTFMSCYIQLLGGGNEEEQRHLHGYDIHDALVAGVNTLSECFKRQSSVSYVKTDEAHLSHCDRACGATHGTREPEGQQEEQHIGELAVNCSVQS